MWGKSRRLVNVPFDEHGRRHPGLWLEVSTAATLPCSPQYFSEMWWERHMFWTEWSVPRVWKTKRIFQLFENFLRMTKSLLKHKTSQDDKNSDIVAIWNCALNSIACVQPVYIIYYLFYSRLDPVRASCAHMLSDAFEFIFMLIFKK